MTQEELGLLVQGFQAAITAAPQVVELVEEAVSYIETLFDKGVITKDQQDAVNAHIAEIQKAVKSGDRPPEFKIDPDPD